jgi:nucleoside-diphosphate-sugar epimerase
VPLRGSLALVTGASGFVGANLVRRLLADGVHVHACVRAGSDLWRLREVLPELTCHEVDLTHRGRVGLAIRTAMPDLVFHLACQRGVTEALDREDARRTNVDGTRFLLEALTRHRPDARVVYTGSSLEYALGSSALSETDTRAPVTVHGTTKASATSVVIEFARERGLAATALRLFTVYGSWEGPGRFVPRLMHSALEGAPLRLTRPGLAHDWIAVEDVVDALILAAKTPGVIAEIVNVGTGRQHTNEELVAIVEGIIGRRLTIAGSFPARVWDTDRWTADVSKARDRLGWVARRDLATGLGETLAWFRRRLPEYESRW